MKTIETAATEQPTVPQVPQTKVIEINANGVTRSVEIRKFPALDGWNMKLQALDFAKSTDRGFRTAFTLDVLSIASVNGRALDNRDAVDTLLGDWLNIEVVFKAVLLFNDIDPDNQEECAKEWIAAGGAMAVAFWAASEKFIGPAFENVANGIAE